MIQILVQNNSEEFGEIKVTQELEEIKDIEEILRYLREMIWKISLVIRKRKIGEGNGKDELAILKLIKKTGLVITIKNGTSIQDQNSETNPGSAVLD